MTVESVHNGDQKVPTGHLADLSDSESGRERLARGLIGYGIAVLSFGVCLGLRWGLDPVMQNRLPFAFFILPIVIAAWRGGLYPSILALMLGAVAVVLIFVEPWSGSREESFIGWVAITSYLFTGSLICYYAETVRRANERLKEHDRIIRAQEEALRSEMEVRRRSEEVLAQSHHRLEDLVRARTAELEGLKNKLNEENVYLRQKVHVEGGLGRLVGQSRAFQRVLEQAGQVATTDSTVLLLGETGTGKGLLAAFVHERSARKTRTLVTVNCAAMPGPLVESELFGREKGAFTGSLSRQMGRFELANGGTIFLDEIGELSLEVQAKLLRVLEEKQVERLGNPQPIAVDVRIVAATNRDLGKAVAEGRFREDLYYRLNVFPIVVPPLRERREDIPPLVWAFVDEFARAFNRNIESIERESMDALQRYSWPGNIRELRNLIERAMIVASGPKLRVQLPEEQAVAVAPARARRLDEVERDHLMRVLEESGWRIRGVNGAAEKLGLKPTTLEARLVKMGIRRPGAAAQV